MKKDKISLSEVEIMVQEELDDISKNRHLQRSASEPFNSATRDILPSSPCIIRVELSCGHLIDSWK